MYDDTKYNITSDVAFERLQTAILNYEAYKFTNAYTEIESKIKNTATDEMVKSYIKPVQEDLEAELKKVKTLSSDMQAFVSDFKSLFLSTQTNSEGLNTTIDNTAKILKRVDPHSIKASINTLAATVDTTLEKQRSTLSRTNDQLSTVIANLQKLFSE
jgi:ABC-type transporter Mla subunit MlaD